MGGSTATFRTILGSIGVVLLGAGSFQYAAAPSPGLVPSHDSPYRAVLDRYCVTCHNEKLRTAGLVLSAFDLGKIGDAPEVWEKVVRKLRAGAMPPAGMPRPDQPTYDSLATHLERALDVAAAARPNPGRPLIHRLNRVEYTNAVRDLLAIDINGGTLLPADDSRYGFDNNGSALTVSPALLEGYMSAARKIVRLAVGDPDIRPVFETYDVAKYLVQDDRMDEALPFGSRGGIAVRHHFPVDGEYVMKVRLARNSRDYIRGLAEPHQLDVRLDGVRIKLFTIGGENKGRSAPIFSNAGIGDPEQEVYERTADAGLQVRFRTKAGPRLIGVAFLKATSAPEGPLKQRLTQYDLMNYKGGDPGVASLSVGGPYGAEGLAETPSRGKIFVCRPITGQDDELCARKILSALARHAYRRPLTEGDVQTLLGFYRSGRSEAGFEAGIGAALERILVGPEFLFRIELDPEDQAPDTAYRISDVALASRLSFFLWSSLPDDELLGLAERGKLKDPGVLEQQVRRLLGDSRSKALVSNFAGQWLLIRNLRSINPDLVIAESQAAREAPALDRPAGIPATFDEYARLMFDLQILAYQTNLTRVSTFMMGRESSDRPFPEIGIPDAHHPLSHHMNDPVKIAKVFRINVYHSKVFAYFLEKMRATPDGDGSLLDHSMIVYASAISDGNAHSYQDLPVLVFGGGAIKHNRHIRFPRDTPMSNLFLTVLDNLGIPLEKFGDSTGKLDPLSLM